ncbi:hypothetical protein Cpar_1563 [Chlorobaculum parvum NCIB 8327]|uniref:Uncharacterized protein n=1 Tax=Chlorobaculum parvum (strain DSM 263 / NCIMB 8327) TaxID=517417 RepID=B3QPV8_CHLP8|nr:hypothetical protein [Chlorobaculum parvum]ACF11961.1 hypothetical protein Cpar_1563 [Chlorobaculum parvum NCIB 8327]
MPTATLPQIEPKTTFLEKLAEMESQLDLMEKEEVETFAACSLSCKICQCMECAKIPGGDV